MPTAFITGITGQDGSYLTELLLNEGYTIHGVIRYTHDLNRSNLTALCRDPDIYDKRLFLHPVDIEDHIALRRILNKAEPDEVYLLGGQTHVGLSFEIPTVTCRLNALVTVLFLEMLRDLQNNVRVFHATSSEMFGSPVVSPQTEETPFHPVTPYGATKAFAFEMAQIFRRSYGLYVCNGIMYNHESPRRGSGFVTQKICQAAAAIKLGLMKNLTLGDTQAKRDWGHARDFVRGMWMSLKPEEAGDYIFATGKERTVQDVVETAFEVVGLNWSDYLKTDSKFLRPADPKTLIGDASKAERVLNWRPEISFKSMIAEMTESEMDRLRQR